MKKLRIIFAGTAYFSSEHLYALIHSSYEIIAVITQPDKPYGRSYKNHSSSVKQLANKYSIPILQPITLHEEKFINQILKLYPDIMIVVSYGKILPKKILNIFPMGCINVHASLLPRWRGATPIQSAIAHGDKKTGITIIKMNEEIDAGDIIFLKECDILSYDTTYTLSLKLIKIGIHALLTTLFNIIHNNIHIHKQNKKYCTLSYKIYKKDALLNWNMPAKKIECLIRAFNPWPICYLILSQKNIKIWKAEVIPINYKNYAIGEIITSNVKGIQINTSFEILNIQQLQFPGKNIIHAKDTLSFSKKIFVNGIIL